MRRNNDALDRLGQWREVVKAATPGRWKVWGMEVRADIDGTSNLDASLPVARTAHESGLRTWNADHIATFDPATMLRVVDGLERVLQGTHDERVAWTYLADAILGPESSDA